MPLAPLHPRSLHTSLSLSMPKSCSIRCFNIPTCCFLFKTLTFTGSGWQSHHSLIGSFIHKRDTAGDTPESKPPFVLCPLKSVVEVSYHLLNSHSLYLSPPPSDLLSPCTSLSVYPPLASFFFCVSGGAGYRVVLCVCAHVFDPPSSTVILGIV